MSERFKNQHRMMDQDTLANTTFVVIGAGAIGSFTIMTLAKMGAQKIHVYDDDIINEHNVSNQLYPYRYMGLAKTSAIVSLAKDFGGMDVAVTKMGRWDAGNAVDGDIVIVAVDNMDTRKDIWLYYRLRPYKLFLEGRMGAQVFRVLGVKAGDEDGIKLYESSLYPQSEATPDPCGEKSIIFCVLSVAAQMAAQVKKFLANEPRPTDVQHDMVNDVILKTYTIKPVFETIEAVEV